MIRDLSWMTGLAGSALVATGLMAGPPPRLAPPPATEAAQSAEPATAADREVQQLMQNLNRVSEQITRKVDSPDGWRYQLNQGEILLQLALRSQGKDAENWLRMAVESYYSAATQSPEADTTARQLLAKLPLWIASTFPSSPTVAYAALQGVRADHMRGLIAAGDNPGKAQDEYCLRLLAFAQAYPHSTEAPRAVQEAARLSESLGKADEAVRYYRHLAENFPGDALGRKAAGSLWRLGAGNAALRIELPLLFAAGSASARPFDLRELRGRVVVVYFWTTSSPTLVQDFDALKRVTDRHPTGALEVVYVNLDGDPARARQFLSDRLTSGTHLHQRGGLDSEVAERHGVQALPHALLIGKDGVPLRRCLKAEQIEQELIGLLPRGR